GRQKAALSFAQQRLWFLQQLETESPAYNVYGSVKLKGRLNEEALRRSLQEIVRRHEALRTRFVEVEGRAMQVVGDRVEVELPVPELAIQYADYAEWQRENLQGEVLEEQLGYWRKQLGGELPVVELPGDHVRPAVRSYRGAQQELRVSREVTEKLRQMSQKEGATLFMTLLAAFDVLLARYSGQEELVVGAWIGNRTGVETGGWNGCLGN